MKIITNKKWDELADALDDWLIDEAEVTIDGEQTASLMRLITGILEVKKE